MMSDPDPKQLRYFKDGQFVTPEPTTYTTPKDSDTRMVHLPAGCIAVLALPLLMVTAVAYLIALASYLSPESATTVGQVRGVVAATPDLEGYARGLEQCVEVQYTVEGREYVHATCEPMPRLDASRVAEDLPEETPAEELGRFIATHPEGSDVKVLHEVEDPTRVKSVADTRVYVSGGGKAFSAGAVVVGTVPLLLAGLLISWSVLAARRRRG
jgi:hypothetical protein